MGNRIKYMLGLCVMGILTLGNNAGFAVTVCPDTTQYPYNGCSLDGLVQGGFPYFSQSVYISLQNKKNGDFSLMASYGGVASGISDLSVSNAIDDSYPIDNTFFQFKARSKNGDVTGSIRIMGKTDGKAQQMLMSADLTGVWSSAGDLIGFNTMNIQCGDAITALVTCTSNDVIYLTQLKDSLDPGGSKGRYTTTGLAVTGLAVTPVPVPAATWLFGSGVSALVALARRRKG